MAQLRFGAFAVIFALVHAALVPPPSVSAQTTAGVDRLAWLAGCWQLRSGSRLVEEQWMPPRGAMMLGMSRTLRGDSVANFEHLRIYQRSARAVYVAAPSGQAPTEFEASQTSDSLVVFENPAHDFPQRIIYRRRGSNALAARIEGTLRGQARAVDFAYRRAGCGGSARISPRQ